MTSPSTPFSGWCWRGADLSLAELAGYEIGGLRRHLGSGEAWTSPLTAHGTLLRIFMSEATMQGGRVRFPADACFRIVALHNLAGGRYGLILRQATATAAIPAGLEPEGAAWAASIPEMLPEPDESQREEARLPFARWAADAREGDAPLTGVIYEFEDAVAFAAAWSGCTSEVTRQVLDARDRYLALAGIAVVEEDEGLHQERVAVAHLLPGEGEGVGDRLGTYIELATGLGPDLIQRVEQGVMAYLDDLGLVVWNNETERSETLGSPYLGD